MKFIRTSAVVTSCRSAIVLSVGSLLFAFPAWAGSGDATWNATPVDDNWDTPANWTPAIVPSDMATFNQSTITNIMVNQNGGLTSGYLFNPGADAFTITGVPGGGSVNIFGGGIINNSTNRQTFVWSTNAFGIVLLGQAKIVGAVTLVMDGGTNIDSLQFQDGSDAGQAIIMNNGSADPSLYGGYAIFGEHAHADSAQITNNGGSVAGAPGGAVYFDNNGMANNAVITNNGSTVAGGLGGTTEFRDNTVAGNATLIANSGSNGGAGGVVQFDIMSQGETAQVEVFGNGTLDISSHLPHPLVAVGSLQGDGQVLLGGNPLQIGASNTNTLFSGVIQGTGAVTKLGTGTLSLNGLNTYTGSTTVSAGTLGGSGALAGPLIVGTGTGTNASIAPAAGSTVATTFTTTGSLTFQSDGIYACFIQPRGAKPRSDQIVAQGVTINSSAQFDLVVGIHGHVPAGKVLTVIRNTAATPINGTFANLADGATINAGGVNLQASYEGGDGNDLTLTVQ